MSESLQRAIEMVLIAHQRKNDQNHCICGWAELGKSFPGHQADEVMKMTLLREVAERRADPAFRERLAQRVTEDAPILDHLAPEDTLRETTWRMAEDINRMKRVCTQEHPPKMASPTRDWTPGTETTHSDGTRCVLLYDGDWHVIALPGGLP